MNVNDILKELKRLANPDIVKLKGAKFGIVANDSLGIYQKDLKVLANTLDQNNELALQLFDTGIYEARILCSKLLKPESITEEFMEKCVVTFENWEICDSFCMGSFVRCDYALPKAIKVAHQMLKMKTKSANWIAKDALRELEKSDVNILDYPREKYRNG